MDPHPLSEPHARPTAGLQAMIQCAARRACTTSLKKGRLCQWRVSGNAQPPRRSRSAGPIAAPEIWSNPEQQCSSVSTQQRERAERERGEAEDHDAESVEHMFDRTPTTLGRDVGRMVRSNQDFLQPEVGLCVSLSDRLLPCLLSEHALALSTTHPRRRRRCVSSALQTSWGCRMRWISVGENMVKQQKPALWRLFALFSRGSHAIDYTAALLPSG